MIKYASNDVIYLPKIYYLMNEIIKDSKTITIEDIKKNSEVYLQYPELNMHISQNSRNLLDNSQIQGLIK